MMLVALLFGMLVGTAVPGHRLWRRMDRRLGALPAAETPEDARAARLRQLGEEGTYRVYNCGRILHVDYERGQLIVEREAWRVR